MRLFPNGPTILSRLKLYMALSRTPHGLLDLAAPGFAALVWLGAFPPLSVTILGIITAFAGYTAVYALNDVMDYRVDQEKIARGGLDRAAGDLDALFIRHPMAQGLLSFKQGVIWVAGWSLLALIGAYLLNPICILIFAAGCVLEAIYCYLLKISYLRTFVSGAVKTSGAIAAVYAVDPSPSVPFLMVLFLWLFLWEIGGQNIPNDWADLDEDSPLQAQTIPVRLGPEPAGLLIVGTLFLAVWLNLVLLQLTRRAFDSAALLAALVAAIFLLLYPAIRLYQIKTPQAAMKLFNRASYYPLALLAVFLVQWGLR